MPADIREVACTAVPAMTAVIVVADQVTRRTEAQVLRAAFAYTRWCVPLPSAASHALSPSYHFNALLDSQVTNMLDCMVRRLPFSPRPSFVSFRPCRTGRCSPGRKLTGGCRSRPHSPKASSSSRARVAGHPELQAGAQWQVRRAGVQVGSDV